ncbi:MAG TPA: hypothetical protein VIZ28_09365 [Chitinophagaceae bacterium]
MKKIIISSCMAVMVIASTAFTFYGDEILTKLGIEKNNASYSILANVNGEDFRLPYTKLLPAVVQGDKVGAAKELCAYIKEYCKSEEFKKAYDYKRESEKPTSEPQPMPAESIKSLKESIKEMEKMMKDPSMKSMPKDIVENYKKGIADMKRMVAEGEDPTPNKTKWEKNYPPVADTLIKRRLQEYLSLVASVDFKAELVTNKYGKKIFVNADYESNSAQWKACFRAGKEVNDAVKLFVQQWLKEL